MMPTDDERREVARMLRQAWANVSDANPVRHHLRVLYEIYAAVGLNDDGAEAIDLFDHLADLIEPGDHIGDSDKMVDRDALLDLADEMYDRLGEYDADLHGGVYMANEMRKYARRIREACGEVGA